MQENRIVELDIRGQICPSTLLAALRSINLHRSDLRRGLQLVIRTDNRAATSTIPEMAVKMGYAVRVEKTSGHYLVIISAGETAPPVGDQRGIPL
jgi:TusA-related sulfurtransferase